MKSDQTEHMMGEEQYQWLDSFEPLIDQYEHLLSSERQLLSAVGSTEALQAIALEKEKLSSELLKYDSECEMFFAEPVRSERIAAVKQRLVQCRSHSRDNNSLVMLQLNHVNKSLELLRSMLRMDDLPLYTGRGTVTVKREKRRIGSA